MLTPLNNKKIKISLPNFLKFAFLNEFFISLQENSKEVFNDNFEISTVEGCFPGSVWTIERDYKFTEKEEIESTINLYSNHNISVHFIFDNECITESDLRDNFSNLMLKCAHRKGNAVYLKSDILHKYIKNNYPLYKIIRQATPKDFNKKDIAIIDKYNNNFDKNAIKYKNSTYITLNPMCSSECKHYEDHRIFSGKEQLNFEQITNSYLCLLKKDLNFYSLFNNPNFISIEKMKEYIDAGYENFRINYPQFANNIGIIYNIYDTAESYLYYLIKSEYQQEVRLQVLQKIESFKYEKIQHNIR